MQRVNPWRTMGAVEFVAAASRGRAASYRERAALLSDLADSEPIGKRRAQLLDLAEQYEHLAGAFKISRA